MSRFQYSHRARKKKSLPILAASPGEKRGPSSRLRLKMNRTNLPSIGRKCEIDILLGRLSTARLYLSSLSDFKMSDRRLKAFITIK